MLSSVLLPDTEKIPVPPLHFHRSQIRMPHLHIRQLLFSKVHIRPADNLSYIQDCHVPPALHFPAFPVDYSLPKIQTVLISIDITAMYVLRHSFSPFCVPLQKHNAEQNTDDHAQNRRCIHQAIRITNIFCLYFPNRVSNCRFLI